MARGPISPLLATQAWKNSSRVCIGFPTFQLITLVNFLEQYLFPRCQIMCYCRSGNIRSSNVIGIEPELSAIHVHKLRTKAPQLLKKHQRYSEQGIKRCISCEFSSVHSTSPQRCYSNSPLPFSSLNSSLWHLHRQSLVHLIVFLLEIPILFVKTFGEGVRQNHLGLQ